MIIQTTKEINGVVYDYAYSDSGFMIERDGVEVLTPMEQAQAEINAYKAALNELGVETEESV